MVHFLCTSVSRPMNLILPPGIGFPFLTIYISIVYLQWWKTCFQWSQVQMVEMVVSQPTWEVEAVCSLLEKEMNATSPNSYGLDVTWFFIATSSTVRSIAFPLLLFPLLVANIFISSISWCCNVTPLNMTLGFNSEWLDNIYASPTVRRAQLQTDVTVTHSTGPAISLPALSQYLGFYKLKIVKHLQMLSPLTLTWP